jgi:hypothetical protein
MERKKAKTQRISLRAQNLAIDAESYLCEKLLVGEGGLEPPASWSQTRRATKLRHSPAHP